MGETAVKSIDVLIAHYKRVAEECRSIEAELLETMAAVSESDLTGRLYRAYLADRRNEYATNAKTASDTAEWLEIAKRNEERLP